MLTKARTFSDAKQLKLLKTSWMLEQGMKLLTHNMLACHIKGVQNGYPFRIEPTKVEEVDADYDPEFLRHIYPRLDWSVLRGAATSMGTQRSPAHPYGVPACLLSTRLTHRTCSAS